MVIVTPTAAPGDFIVSIAAIIRVVAIRAPGAILYSGVRVDPTPGVRVCHAAYHCACSRACFMGQASWDDDATAVMLLRAARLLDAGARQGSKRTGGGRRAEQARTQEDEDRSGDELRCNANTLTVLRANLWVSVALWAKRAIWVMGVKTGQQPNNPKPKPTGGPNGPCG